MDCLEETFHIGRELGVPVVISHHKVVGRPIMDARSRRWRASPSR